MTTAFKILETLFERRYAFWRGPRQWGGRTRHVDCGFFTQSGVYVTYGALQLPPPPWGQIG